MTLSSSERKFRTKLIQENYFNKIQQRILDDEISKRDETYKEIYKSETKRGFLITIIAFSRLSMVMNQMAISAQDASSILSKIGNVWHAMCGTISEYCSYL